MMTTKYRTPDGKLHASCPSFVIDSNGAPHIGVTPETFGTIPGCSKLEVPDPDPITPTIPEPIQLIATQILQLWATTGLPAPADWTAARAALRPWVAADPLNRNVTLTELLSLRIELAELGGTWSHVLTLATPITLP